MKIQCSVCEATEATVLCCADEAALCSDCDEKVHAANKLASKHQRVSLSNSSSQIPKCDICQETTGYFFCLEDRALLCRKCDVAIHTVNPYVSAHRRFLLTGVKVGLEPAESAPSSSAGKSPPADKLLDTQSTPMFPAAKSSVPPIAVSGEQNDASPGGVGDLSKKNSQLPLGGGGDYSKMMPVQGGLVGDFTPSRMVYTSGGGGGSFAAGSIPQWHYDDFLGGLGEFNQNYGFMDHGSSKADSGKFGESDSSSFLRSSEDDLDMDERLGQVPDVSWNVPQVPSPPTASGLYWPKSSCYIADSAAYVPDICGSPPFLFSSRAPANNVNPKRARRF